jgi:hypothetical protein
VHGLLPYEHGDRGEEGKTIERKEGRRQGGLSLCLAINTEKGEEGWEDKKIIIKKTWGTDCKRNNRM